MNLKLAFSELSTSAWSPLLMTASTVGVTFISTNQWKGASILEPRELYGYTGSAHEHAIPPQAKECVYAKSPHFVRIEHFQNILRATARDSKNILSSWKDLKGFL